VEPLKLQIRTRARGEPAGFDSAITDLRTVSERLAANIGEILHHASWVITGDPELVRTLGMMHDCATCRAGVANALDYLAGEPGREVAVGQLWWADPAVQWQETA
jgi:hypothetical protein